MDPETPDNNQVPSTPPITNSLRTIRTLKGDVEAGMAQGKTTVVSMAAAETERRAREATFFENKATEPMRKAKIVGFFLLALGTIVIAGGLFYYFVNNQASEDPQARILPPDYIYSEQFRLLNLNNASGDQVVTELGRARQETTGQLGSIAAIIPIETGSGVSRALTGDELLTRLDPQAPQEVTRTLQGPFLFGVHVFDGNQPFLILKPDAYETSFAGMLAWESSLPFRLGRALRPAADWTNASSSLTSVTWNDMVISNKDARVLRSKEGKTLLLYSFIDRSTLVITTNEQTFGEIVRRISLVRATQ
ncbi:hypothetical protein K8Q93_00945 [Candidatus Parcubacteria bacterium]|nr:hypothetical protein [Candidatus Parcubacteria bacterium]